MTFKRMINAVDTHSGIPMRVITGGVGHIPGASLFVFAQSYLQDGLHVIHDAVSGVAPLALLFEPDRWLLWLGILFVVSVYYFPTGIAGRLRELARRH